MVVFIENEIFDNISLDKNEITLEIDSEIIHYFRNVLRLKPSEKITINSMSNTSAQNKYLIAKILEFVDKRRLKLKIETKEEKQNYLPLIDLYMVPLKSRYLDSAIENVCQTPINKIYLIQSQLISTNFSELIKKIERLKKISLWTSIYVKKPFITEIDFIKTSLKELVEKIKDKYEKIIIFDNTVEKELTKIQAQTIAIFIGPEGGWHNEELKYFSQKKLEILRFKKISIGTKAEIASTIAVSQILALT